MKPSFYKSISLGLALVSVSSFAVNNMSIDALNSQIQLCYLETEKSDNASTAACNRVLSADLVSRQNKAIALHNRGVIYYKQGNQDKALENFTRAAKLQPDMPETLVAKAHLLKQQQKLDEAKNHLVKANALHNQSKRFVAQLGDE